MLKCHVYTGKKASCGRGFVIGFYTKEFGEIPGSTPS